MDGTERWTRHGEQQEILGQDSGSLNIQSPTFGAIRRSVCSLVERESPGPHLKQSRADSDSEGQSWFNQGGLA
jgi:hypothetical protein